MARSRTPPEPVGSRRRGRRASSRVRQARGPVRLCRIPAAPRREWRQRGMSRAVEPQASGLTYHAERRRRPIPAIVQSGGAAVVCGHLLDAMDTRALSFRGATMDKYAEFGLIRSIRKWDLVAVTINAVIGAGIFGLPSKVYAFAG